MDPPQKNSQPALSANVGHSIAKYGLNLRKPNRYPFCPASPSCVNPRGIVRAGGSVGTHQIVGLRGLDSGAPQVGSILVALWPSTPLYLLDNRGEDSRGILLSKAAKQPTMQNRDS